MSSILALPPVPPELKAVSPFLSRAEELAKQDPIISYWCEDLCLQITGSSLSLSFQAHTMQRKSVSASRLVVLPLVISLSLFSVFLNK